MVPRVIHITFLTTSNDTEFANTTLKQQSVNVHGIKNIGSMTHLHPSLTTPNNTESPQLLQIQSLWTCPCMQQLLVNFLLWAVDCFLTLKRQKGATAGHIILHV